MKSLPARLEAAERMRETLVEDETVRLLTTPGSQYYYLTSENIAGALSAVSARNDAVARFCRTMAESADLRIGRLCDAYATIAYYHAKDAAEAEAERTTPCAEEIEQDLALGDN